MFYDEYIETDDDFDDYGFSEEKEESKEEPGLCHCGNCMYCYGMSWKDFM